MNHILFYKSFVFHTLHVKHGHHTDNSRGISKHFIARMWNGRARFVTLTGEVLTVREGDIFYLPQGNIKDRNRVGLWKQPKVSH